MSAENKTRYEIQKILSDCIKLGLNAYIGEGHGFGVMEFAQASFQKADKIVLMNLVRSNRIGFQGYKYPILNDELKRTDEWIECQHWQFHVILKRDSNPTIETRQADDIASILIAWFNGRGCEFLREYGCANERVDASSLVVYTDDSDLYQKRAVFTVKVQVPKELTLNQPDMSAEFAGFHGV